MSEYESGDSGSSQIIKDTLLKIYPLLVEQSPAEGYFFYAILSLKCRFYFGGYYGLILTNFAPFSH